MTQRIKNWKLGACGTCLRVGFAVLFCWCTLVEIAETVADARFGMILDGDWFLLLTESSKQEIVQFIRLHAMVLTMAAGGFISVSAFVTWASLRSSRRVFIAVVATAATLACVRIVQSGSAQEWKPIYVAFDTLRSAREYRRIGDAGRWTSKRAANVRIAPSCATNYVFVIGESLTTARIPFFGYAKNTMPRLSELGDALAKCGPIRAPSPYTVTSLMRLFVDGDATAPVWFRLAGWRTCFVSAQERWERYCSVETAIFSACERKVYLSEVVKSETGIYDEMTLPYAKEMMSYNDGRPFALFIHMMGSHFEPEKRVPPGFAENEELDAYDRSVRYTDNVLAQLIAMLPPRTELIFISDHGESVDEGGWRDVRSEALWSVPAFIYPAAASSPMATADDFVAAWRSRAR